MESIALILFVPVNLMIEFIKMTLTSLIGVIMKPLHLSTIKQITTL